MGPDYHDLPLLVLAAAAVLVAMETLARHTRQGQVAATDPSPAVVRRTVIALLLVAAAAHVPVIPEHLEEAPYMGVLFIGFTLAAFGVAAALAVSPTRAWYLATAGLSSAAVCAYVATRLVAFPQLAHDVGLWVEPLGLVSISAETAACLLGLLAVRSPQRLKSPIATRLAVRTNSR